MITIKTFVFNAFQVNSFVLYDETKECIIIDPSCYSDYEKNELTDFIDTNELKVVGFYNTHCHVDHIFGNEFISRKYDLLPIIHKAGLPFLKTAKEHALGFGFDLQHIVYPETFVDETDIIKFGNSELKIIYTPGHADGSICFYNEDQKFVIVGDVLFNGSIGRTDFPTGNYEMLINNIQTKLFGLGDDFKVYCGHGPETTIGSEKIYNPFVGM